VNIFSLEQICTLNTRIAAADSMTHDVIRDLLGVKMDITSYAVSISEYMPSSKDFIGSFSECIGFFIGIFQELIDQHQVQRVVEKAQQHAEEILSKVMILYT